MIRYFILGFSLVLAFNPNSLVQAAAPITPSGLNTQVTLSATPPAGKTQYDITGGTRPGGGPNLFHSFGQFNVPTNNIANFLNSGSINPANSNVILPAGLPTSNILGRINGGNPSSIFGMIQTNGPGGFPTANLFLMNPNGFLFGPNASINVGGIVTFTTADYLRHTDNTQFNAVAGPADALLTAAPVAAFGFLGNNPAAIAVQGSTLQVAQGQSLSLVGGNQGFTATNPDTGNPINVPGGITMTGAKLSAPGGQINIASVASPGEIAAGTLSQAPNINGQSFATLGAVQVSQKSIIDASGDGGGTVLIRGGRFLLDNSTISANTTGPAVGPLSGPPGAGIDIQVAQDAVIQNAGVLQTNVTAKVAPGIGSGGVHVTADHIEIVGIPPPPAAPPPFTGIQSQTSGSGNSGDITLVANSILLKNFAQIQTMTTGAPPSPPGPPGPPATGNAGNISLTAHQNLEMNTALVLSISASPFTKGNAGNINLTSEQGNISLSGLPSGSFVTSQAAGSGGTAGALTIGAPHGDILLDNSAFNNSILGSGGSGGGIQVTAHNLTMGTHSGGTIGIDNSNPQVPGNITVTLSGNLSLDGGSVIQTVARASARAAADLNITAHDVSITGGSVLNTQTVSSGAAGRLNIFADTLEVTNGGQIRNGSAFTPPPPPSLHLPPPPPPTGPGGSIAVQGFAGSGSTANSVLIDGIGSGIVTNTVGTGPAGNTNIAAQSLTIQNGGTISATTSGAATSATGGSILVKADAVTLTTGGTMTAASTGPGAAGNITINAGTQFAMTNSSVTTEADQSSGGKITITTNPNGTVQLTDSKISASVLDGTGGGGSVTIDPQYVLLQNSQILANAVFGPGGNIFITTNLLQPDSTSVISASSQFGQNGTITVQSPIAPASRIIVLSQKPLVPTSLLTARCAALAGGKLSSFTVAGRENLPAEPTSWLSSPLASATSGFDDRPVSEPVTPTILSESTEEMPILSLRRIAPPGFLTQGFAADWSTGCTS